MNPYAIIGAILMAITLAWGGYEAGWDKRGEHEAAIALKAKGKADELLTAARKRADGLAGDLALEKQNIKTVLVEKIKEVPVVTTVYKESINAPTQPIPPAVYTAGFVRVWNDAYRTITDPTGASQPDDPPGEADLVRAQVSSADILTNHIENAGKHADCYAQLNKLIDYEVGKAAPPGE